MRGVGFSMNREVGRLHRMLGAVLGLLVIVVSVGWLLERHAQLPRWVDGVRSLVAADSPVLLVDPVKPQRQWLGTSRSLFWSVDGGAHWNRVSFGDEGAGVQALVLDGRLSGLMYGLTKNSQVVRSDDGGRQWRWIPGPRRDRSGDRLVSLQVVSNGRLMALGEAGFYQQVDAGWQFKPYPAALRRESLPWLEVITPYLKGEWGAWALDALAGAALVLTLSGYGMFGLRVLRTRAARRRSLAVFQQRREPGALVFRFPSRSPFLE